MINYGYYLERNASSATFASTKKLTSLRIRMYLLCDLLLAAETQTWSKDFIRLKERLVRIDHPTMNTQRYSFHIRPQRKYMK